MHVIHPTTYKEKKTPKRKRKLWRFVLILVVLAAAYNYIRPLPAATATISVQGLGSGAAPTIAWPASGQAAIGAPGYDVLATYGTQAPLATASIAKVILALSVLQKQPLEPGKTGTAYTVTAQDVAIYNNYVAGNGSVAAVAQGERLTEYEALEALMLPSANNIADSLVRWVFGSQANYKSYADNFLATNGMTHTTIGSDASGYDPSTTSTASDLTKLGLLALKSPVLLSIAKQSSTTLPVAGKVTNYDTILGVNGINGLKTGNNDDDPGAFLFTASVLVGSEYVPITGAIMDAPDLNTALRSAATLSASMQQNFAQTTVASTHEQIGTMRTAWGVSEPIVTDGALQVVHWKSTAIQETHKIQTTLRSGQVGTLQVSAPGSKAKTTLSLSHPVAGPSFWWRLTRH